MVKSSKKNPAKLNVTEKTVSCKDMNSQARENFIQLITADGSLTSTWRDTITPLVQEKIPDDLSPLQKLIEGVPYVKTETAQS
jgi:hypothetical protein